MRAVTTILSDGRAFIDGGKCEYLQTFMKADGALEKVELAGVSESITSMEGDTRPR